MWNKYQRREIPELNTTSTADISFILLIFFLVTTSIGADKGIQRELPSLQPEQEQVANVREGAVLHVKILDNDQLQVEGDVIARKDFQRRVKDFIKETGRSHVIQLDSDPQAHYSTYFHVQDDLLAAYRILRDEKAQEAYHRGFSDCTADQQKSIVEAIPQRVSELYEERGER